MYENVESILDAEIYKCERLLSEKKYDECIKQCDELIKKEDVAAAWYLKGMCYYQLKRFDDAVKLFEKASEIEPKSDIPYSGKGLCYFQSGRMDVAISEFEKALNKNPRDIEILALTAFCYAMRGNSKKMNEYLKKAADSNPQAAMRLVLILSEEFAKNKGASQVDKDNVKKIVEDMKKAAAELDRLKSKKKK